MIWELTRISHFWGSALVICGVTSSGEPSITLCHANWRTILTFRELPPIQVDRTLVAEDFGRRGILEQVADRFKLAVDQGPLTYQSNTMAVIFVIGPMDRA